MKRDAKQDAVRVVVLMIDITLGVDWAGLIDLIGDTLRMVRGV